MRRRPGILFLCVANSALSQLAEGLARAMLGERARIQSAGSCPSHVHPCAIEVMNEVGVDLSTHTSKSVDSIDPSTVDLVVTMCAEAVPPAALAQVRRFHWSILDPAAAPDDLPPDELLHRFRSTRDTIMRQLDQLVASELLL
jgi:arsenate reductase (thioredoxin)